MTKYMAKKIKQIPEIKIKTLEDACDRYGVEYREGVTGLKDLAKVVGAGYADGDRLEQILEQIPKNLKSKTK